MNINIKQIEQLVEAYIQLDEEDQKDILVQTYILSAKSVHKKALKDEIQKTGKKMSDVDFDATVSDKTCESYKKAKGFTDKIMGLPPEKQAAILMFMNKKGLLDPMLEQTDVKVSVTQSRLSVEELIDRYLPQADKDKVKETYIEMMKLSD